LPYQSCFWDFPFLSSKKKHTVLTVGLILKFEQSMEQANLNPNAELIKGVISGYRIEELQNQLTQKVRCHEKVADEPAEG
jgi:hypothetical protein